MPHIDRETVQRIIDAADIVEVVSDYVTLKRRGANYIGLCPFHNERTPSFSVSKAKGICKCFSCGKGGSAVNFIMEIEQMTYYEALRHLAKKYGIEIKERELTPEEKQAETDREAMLAVNEFAMHHFAHNLLETETGRNIGLEYFRERGINDQMVKRFSLGYAMENNDDLLTAARSKGYKEDYLLKTGLVSRNERGAFYDRFRGRVIYPIRSLSGRVLAFGGRTLRTDKTMAKYVNSPESVIYSKRRELYGLYQARQAISRRDKCILVEGYMDVISMHQSGVENVVASSGTSLTVEQVSLISRFTKNVTVIYDSDAAGIKASLRGIGLLLAQGLNVKVLLLPDGDDPDSFAQSHSSSEVEAYLEANETDFVAFQTRILLDDAKNDPINRARAITTIVRTIAVIPDDITRAVYIQQCSRDLQMDEGVLTLQVQKFRMESDLKESQQQARDENRERLDQSLATEQKPSVASPAPAGSSKAKFLRPFELEILKYVLRYGCLYICESLNESGAVAPMSVLEFIADDLRKEDIEFTNPDIAKTFAEAREAVRNGFEEYMGATEVTVDQEIARRREERRKHLREMTGPMDHLNRLDKEMNETLEQERQELTDGYISLFISRQLMNHPDDDVRRLTTELVSDRYTLSKVHTKYSKIETDRERIYELAPRALYELKDAIIECRLRDLRSQLNALAADENADLNKIKELLSRVDEQTRLKAEFAKVIGERVITAH